MQQDITANDTKIAEVTRNINDYQQMLDELYKPFQTLNLSAARHQAAPKMVIVGRPSAKAHDEEHFITRDEINMAERLRKSCAKYSNLDALLIVILLFSSHKLVEGVLVPLADDSRFEFGSFNAETSIYRCKISYSFALYHIL